MERVDGFMLIAMAIAAAYGPYVAWIKAKIRRYRPHTGRVLLEIEDLAAIDKAIDALETDSDPDELRRALFVRRATAFGFTIPALALLFGLLSVVFAH